MNQNQFLLMGNFELGIHETFFFVNSPEFEPMTDVHYC